MISKRIISSFIIITVSLLFFSCRHKGDIPATPQISFSQQVQPILVSNCCYSGCHTGGGGAGGRHLRPYETYDEVIAITSPGDADGSTIYQRITGRSGNSMPPNTFLTESQIITIYTWIMQGALNN